MNEVFVFAFAVSRQIYFFFFFLFCFVLFSFKEPKDYQESIRKSPGVPHDPDRQPSGGGVLKRNDNSKLASPSIRKPQRGGRNARAMSRIWHQAFDCVRTVDSMTHFQAFTSYTICHYWTRNRVAGSLFQINLTNAITWLFMPAFSLWVNFKKSKATLAQQILFAFWPSLSSSAVCYHQYNLWMLSAKNVAP